MTPRRKTQNNSHHNTPCRNEGIIWQLHGTVINYLVAHPGKSLRDALHFSRSGTRSDTTAHRVVAACLSFVRLATLSPSNTTEPAA